MKTSNIVLFFLIAFVFAYYFYKHPTIQFPPHQPSPSLAPHSTALPPVLGARTKSSECVVRGPLPDPDCSPGAIFPNATKEQICQPGYSRSVRDVSASTKERVYKSYGIIHHSPGEYEVDHIISLQLGGSNEIANLYPEAGEPRPGYHEKDLVENYLHDQVCSGIMSLQEAQYKIATNWLEVYYLIEPQ